MISHILLWWETGRLAPAGGLPLPLPHAIDFRVDAKFGGVVRLPGCRSTGPGNVEA